MVFISHDEWTSGRSRAWKSRVHPSPRGCRNPHPRAISNAATYWIPGTLYTMCNTYVYKCTYLQTRPSTPLRIGTRYAACTYVTRRVCVGREDLATGLPPSGAYINQKLRFRPNPKHGQTRNLDAPGVPEVISPRGKWVAHGIGN